MKPAISQIPKHIRKQIGSALWLFALLAHFTPAEWTGDTSAWVASGNVISDAELAERLEVSSSAIATWRRRLHKTGLLGWLVSPGNGRAFFITAVNQVLGAGLAGPKSPAVAVWQVVNERSIALTGKVVEDLSPEEGLQLATVLARGSEIVGEAQEARS